MATLSRMVKKAASSVIAAANRAPHRNYTSAIFITPLKTSTLNTTNLFREVFRTSIPTYHYFSDLPNKKSNSSDTLVSAIVSEIDRAEKEFHDLEVAEIPIKFPFKIEDNAEEPTVTLTREYQGEEIKLTVRKPDVSDDEYYSDTDSDEEEKKFNIQMFVSVTKKSRPTLKFHVVADQDKFTITSLALKNPNASNEDIAYEGPEFSHLDKNLQEGFYPYLEVRGIKPSITKFLHNYMVSKKYKKYTAWMKNLKNVIAD